MSHVKIMRDSTEPKDRVFVKGYRFLPFAENMSKNIGKNASKNLTGKCSQKLLQQMLLKLLKKSNSNTSRSNWPFHWK